VPNLSEAKIKLDRAKVHIQELSQNAKTFLASSPFSIDIEEENDDLVHRVRIQKTVPKEWAAIVGDAVHNIRSTLDYMIWQLILRNGGTPGRNTCFPIGVAKSGYGKQLRSSLSGASVEAKKYIRRLKPYPGGNQILVQIHALDICDKHHLALIVGSAHKNLLLTMKMKAPWIPDDFKFPTIALNPADRQFPLSDGDEVFRIKAAARTEDDLSEHGLVFELAFGDVNEVKGLPLLETLSSMESHVSKIIEICERHFFG
jgi:hypothetical protein